MTEPLLDVLLESNAAPVRPELALIFHTRGAALELVTTHEVRHGRGGPSLGPGRPLAPEDESKVMQLLNSADTDTREVEVFPPGLLTMDRFQIAWWVPPARRPMHFRAHDGQKVRESVRHVAWPGLVMRVVGQRLSIAAVVGDERPTASTRLVKAPLPNVWATGVMCTGNAPLPDALRVNDIPGWEAVVFDSAFSHANDPDVVRVRGRAVDPMTFWQREDATFTARNAVPLNQTLGQWLAGGADKE